MPFEMAAICWYIDCRPKIGDHCEAPPDFFAGCTLPVEMFFPLREFPTAALEAALAELGVVCRPLPEVDLPRSNATDTETDLSGFTMKVAALLLSRFQEVSCSDPLSYSLPSHGSPFAFQDRLPSCYRAQTGLLQAWGPCHKPRDCSVTSLGGHS